MSGIFGGSKSKSQSTQSSQSTSSSQSGSGNVAYPWLQDTYKPVVDNGLQANSFMSSLLGLNGNPAANDAFDQYKNGSGYNFVLDQGNRNITSSAAGRGLFNSGSTMKALSNFGQNTASQYYNTFLDKLLGLSNQGQGAGQMISGAGQQSFGNSNATSSSTGQSTGESSTSPNLGPLIGSLLGSVAGGK